jgi:hypothetical protein
MLIVSSEDLNCLKANSEIVEEDERKVGKGS